jgi:hypothetical protein
VARFCDSHQLAASGSQSLVRWEKFATLRPLRLVRALGDAAVQDRVPDLLIRLQVEHLSGDRDPKPVWLWTSVTRATAADVDRWWQVFLRRFDLEHTFRLLKQTLGWTRPKIRTPEAADRWTCLIVAAHTQLRLARPLAADLRRPRGTPRRPRPVHTARVRRSFAEHPPDTLLPDGHQNPADPAPGAHPASATGTPRPATTSARPSNATAPSPPDISAQVEDQTQGLS